MRKDNDNTMRRKQAKERRSGSGLYKILSIIYTVLFVCFAGILIWLNMLPAKYLYPLLGVLLLISVFIVPVLFSRNGKKKRQKTAAVLAVILSLVFGAGTYFLGSTLGFLSDITGALGINSEEYYVIVDSESEYDDVQQLQGAYIGTYMDSDASYAEAKNKLAEEVTVEYAYISDMDLLYSGLQNAEYPAEFVSATSYNDYADDNETLKDETRIIYTVKVTVGGAAAAKNVDVTKEPFNVYVSGIDTTGEIANVSRTDVNMIVTVNPQTNEVLITSIPRDYYVMLPSKGAYDKLTHSGLYGINESIAAAEQLLGIEINYYARVNFTTVVQLVDAIGGVDVDSPLAFTTHGMGELNNITFVQGINHLDGNMALAFCRERKSFVNGDMQRNENQQLVMEAIIKKLTSSAAIITNYGDLLDAVNGNVETNFSASELKSLVKYQLGGMPSWNIEKNALKGTAGSAYCYALGQNASVVQPDQAQVVQATEQIIGVMNGGESEAE